MKTKLGQGATPWQWQDLADEAINDAREWKARTRQCESRLIECRDVLKAAQYAGALSCCCPDDAWFTCWACKAKALLAKLED